MMRTPALLFCFFFATRLFGQSAERKLVIAPLTGDFYIYTTYNVYKGNRIGANALYLVTEEGVVLFDTPWDTTQFQPLLDSIRIRHNKDVVLCLATHFHKDRTGGLQFYRQKGISTYTTKLTDSLSLQRGMNRAEFLMQKDTAFTVGGYSFQTYYPGPGHAPDNIVVWFEKEKILYGGCLIKSVEETTLGNLADANPAAYATTLRNLRRRFKKPRYVITGHNDYTHPQAVEHTLKMAETLQQKNP
jgi:metallo-beta-lactamase class B